MSSAKQASLTGMGEKGAQQQAINIFFAPIDADLAGTPAAAAAGGASDDDDDVEIVE
jgi:hypothetical protein